MNCKREKFCYLYLLMIIVFVFSYFLNCEKGEKMQRYKISDLPVSERVKDLLGRMTIEEKVAQLQCLLEDTEGKDIIDDKGIGNLGTFLRPYEAKEAAEKMNRVQKFFIEETRLGIPVLMHDEALHGLVGKKATSFPQAIGLAATWNTDLMEKVAGAIALETNSRGIRQVLSPVVNISRDVRWGRVEESYGEDPYLTAKMGVAFCKPFEEMGVITTPKHYVANIGDGGRDSNPVHFSERQLREIYFPGFKACFQEAGATSVMSAYNSYDGLPCTSNKWLLTDILRKEWGFKGFVVSDYGSVGGIYTAHYTAATEKEAAADALEAGLDIELPSIYIYGEPLLEALKEGLVSEATLNKAVSRVLTAKFKLGLFEEPYVDPDEADLYNDSNEHRLLAREAARQSIVLLKNEDKFLPLDKNIKSVVVIGADADVVRLGGYSGYGMKTVTILDGIKDMVSNNTKVYYEKGFDLGGAILPPIPEENLFPAGGKKGEQGLKGEYFSNKNLEGEPALVRIDEKIHFDWATGSPAPELPSERFSVRWTGKMIPKVTGEHRIGITTDDGVRLYIDGKLLVDKWIDRGATSDIVSFKLQAGKEYDVKIEYYENSGYSYASFGWDVKLKDDRQMKQAISAAKKSDVVIFVAGVVEGEGKDRADLDLSDVQENLIKSIAKTGTPTAVVIIGGSAVTMTKWIGDASAIIEAWYPGEEGGNAIAEVLFGEYNPAGRLPITFPQSVAQIPLYYNHKPTGRGYDYVDMTGKPLFPFGYGLSYTEFEYSNLNISPKKIRPGETISVTVDVENTGNRNGDEVVQLYLHDKVGSIARPVKELKGFQRISLDSGEKKTVKFELTPESMSMLDINMNRIVEPGTFEVMIGSSSEDIRERSTFEVVQ